MNKSTKATPHEAQPGAFTIEEFARTYRIGRSTVYELLDSGALRSFHVGRRRLISFRAAEEWQLNLESNQHPSAA